MRKVYPILFSVFALFLLITPLTHAQICQPDPLCNSGICPDTTTGLPAACAGSAYAATLTVVIPPDTVIFGQTYDIQNITIDSITGMPAGFVYNCEPGSCVFPGGGSYCVILDGFPTAGQVGNYPIVIHSTFSATHPVLPPIMQSVQLTGYDIDVVTGPTPTFTTVQPFCGGTNGSISAVVTGNSPFSYLWSNGDTNTSVSGLPPGQNCLTVTDGNGCLDSLCTTLVDQPGPALDSVTVTGNLCFEDLNGTATAIVTGGTPPLVYSWSQGSGTGPTVTGLPSGNLNVTVVDSNGCADTAFTAIPSPSPLSVSIGHSDETCAGCNDGTANAFITGGTQPYTVSWSNGSTQQSITNLAPGTYVLTVLDDNNCGTTDSITVLMFVSVHEALSREVKVYPNPNQGQFKVAVQFDSPKDFRIELFDLQGRSLHSQSFTDLQEWTGQINPGPLPKGLYYLRLDDGERTANRKIIVR